jgi:hypothetical protein
MSSIPEWLLCAIVVVQVVANILLGLRCDTLSKRLDIVHKRISNNSKINNLIDHWDDEEPVMGARGVRDHG